LKRYCFDTSGFSTPHEQMPEDVRMFQPMWSSLDAFVRSGVVATTTELYEEMCRITGSFGDCIRSCKTDLIMEVDNADWDGLTYIREYERMCIEHRQYISEYTHMSSKETISLNDMTIIALAKTLKLPVVSSESSSGNSPLKRRIPDMCKMENVIHRTFVEFLRDEGLQ